MDIRWVRIVSWHAVKGDSIFTTRGGMLAWGTHCGRTAFGEPVDDLPSEKSCETCLRMVARRADA
jgi:hypothetical protein